MKRGFTIIEMLVVVVLFIIVGAFGGRLFYQTVTSISREQQAADVYAARQALLRQMRDDVWHAQSIVPGERLGLRIGDSTITYEFVPGKAIRHASEDYAYILATSVDLADGKAATGKATVDRGVVSVDCGDERVVILLSPIAAASAGGAR